MAKTAQVKDELVLSKEIKVEKVNIQGPGDNEGVANDCQNLAIDVYEREIGSGADDLTLLNALMSMCELK